MVFVLIFLSLIFLAWGSFLNVVGFRTINGVPFFKARSFCPLCRKPIAFYDNIPVFSWIFLRAKCRYCKGKISFLYPFIEIITLFLMLCLTKHIFSNYQFDFGSSTVFVAYFIFFTALIVATRTDLESMVIPQLFSLWLVPVGFLFSFLGFLKINFLASLIGAILGYGILWIVAKLFKLMSKKDGIGVGDMEFLAMIGAFLGPFGVWFSLLIGSITGVVIGCSYLFIFKKLKCRIPFGPFLALGAVTYFFYQDFIWQFLFT